MKCANCGTESSGNFCPSCGARLRASTCSECGADLNPGARFCTRCGTGVADGAAAASRGGPRASSPNLPWYIAGAVLLALILILLVPMLTDSGNETAQGPFVPGAMDGATTPGSPPPLTGTPREQADRLYNRIMSAREQGDSAGAVRFTPMAIDAYGMAGELDNDGLYHLATVHVVAGDFATARSTADRILAREPDHILGLAVAAEAAALAGDSADARALYQRLLRSYDTESARGLQEYLDHSRVLPEYREAARRFTGS
jgi:tetratricopeptide (TPR) repeat protein